MRPVLIDTGAIVGLLDQSEKYHKNCSQAFETLSRPLITCEAVIAEACHLLRRIPGASEAILKNIQHGIIRIPWVLTGREARVSELLQQYAKVPMDLADACLVCMAEEFDTGDILTLDWDFEVYRWSSRQSFTCLIDKAKKSKK
jgi:predicted nucleic acid-binding protein